MVVVKLGLGKAEKVQLTKPRALALQTELLDAFTTPKFQKKLNEIARKHSKSEEKDKAYTSFKHLVRKSQREIIPRYGFDASEEGVESMMKAFRQFKDDPDIYVNECAIKEALSLTHGDSTGRIESPSETLSESLLRSSNGTSSSGSLRNLVVVWLRHLIVRFSTPTFQAWKGAKTKLWSKESEPTPKEPEPREPTPEPAGPTEPTVTPEMLEPKLGGSDGDGWGFEAYYELLAKANGSKGSMPSRLEGVKAMIREVCMLDDVEVIQLFNTMNMKLGMAADACGPFRDSLRLHLIQAESES